MSTYVLRRHSPKGGYVAKPGHASSYVTDLRYAQKYSTREAAVRDSCIQNETPVPLEHLLDRVRA